MNGKELKDKLLTITGLSLADIAGKLGMTPQHLNQTLNAADIKSGFLQKVCATFNVEIGQLFDNKEQTKVFIDSDNNEDEPQPSVNTGDHSSTAVGAGSTAIHGADAEKYLEIIREQQKSITKLIDTITSNLSQISDSVSGLSDSVSDISDSVSDLSNSVEKLSDPSKTQ